MSESLVLPSGNQSIMGKLQSWLDIDEEKFIQAVEKRNDIVRRMVLAGLQQSTRKDWVDFEGTPYPTATLAMKVNEKLGASLRIVELRRESHRDSKGDVTGWTCMVEASIEGRSVEDAGYCDSREPFFAKKGGVFKEDYEINHADLQSKAITKAQRRALVKLIATLSGLTKESIESFYNKGSESSVNFASKETKPEPIKNGNGKRKFTAQEKEEASQKLYLALARKFDGDESKVNEEMKRLTAFDARPKGAEWKDLTPPWVETVLNKNPDLKELLND